MTPLEIAIMAGVCTLVGIAVGALITFFLRK